MAKTWSNYGKNLRFRPSHVARPDSRDDLSALIRRHEKLRVMGARHSWSPAIMTDGCLVSLDKFDRVLEIDRCAMEVEVEAGIRLRDLQAALFERGLGLANLGSIDEQSLAGAIATGTHGTGISHACLADQVVALELIDGRGDIRRLRVGDPDFDAAVVGLGAFGIVYRARIRVVPSFRMHAIVEPRSFDQVIANIEDIVTGHDHVKFWWLVPSDQVIVFRQDHTSELRNDSRAQRFVKEELLAVGIYRALLAAQKLWRGPLVRWTNQIVGAEFAKRREYVCESPGAFLAPKPPVHREAEWAFDFRRARELLADYRAHFLTSAFSFSFIQEIRFSRADSFWLSPSSGRDSIWLSLYNIDSAERWLEQRRAFDDFAKSRGGRPHWGKEFALQPSELRACYPRLESFWRVAESYDPQGVFRNRWLESIRSP